MIINIGSLLKDNANNVYFLDEVIGQGGFGIVYKSHRKSDNALYAIKTMLPSFGDSSSVLSFKNEIKLAKNITGENIIKYEYIHSGDDYPELPPYIIMEYANGGTLRDILSQRQQQKKFFETDELINIFTQLANGMNEINKKLVHRDIKPENVLICDDKFKISDFGLSKIASENTRTMSFKGGGTPFYMSPEAWDYSKKNTVQMDIYSMGIVFYELAALQYPYDLKRHTLEDCKEAHLYSTIKNLSALNSSLPANIVSVINRMLEKPTQKRFLNWQDILQLITIKSNKISYVDNFVSKAIAIKNQEDITLQNQISEQKKKIKEKEDFCKLIYSQFGTNILSPIRALAENFNDQYAGSDKYSLSNNITTATARPERFYWNMKSPSNKTIFFDMEALLLENHITENTTMFGERIQVNYIPQCQNKKILSWGKISNKEGYGFNLLLLEGKEIYGDWFIMTNKNSGLSNHKRRVEPFGFDLNELPEEIGYINAMHIYTTKIDLLTEENLLNHIQLLETL